MLNIDLGHFCFATAWLLAVYAFLAGLCGVSTKRISLSSSAFNAVALCSLFSVLAFAGLAFDFISSDFRYLCVWQNSDRSMPMAYRISAMWGGMSGSMLLWAVFQAVYAGLALFTSRQIDRSMQQWLVPVFAFSIVFFHSIVLFYTNPFQLIPQSVVPDDGQGLNPLLQNPYMLIHPPLLYAGFVGFVVPFTFALAALLSGRLNLEWIHQTRRWTLTAWCFLTAGIVLGAYWAYVELGWGGFWAWDPVENASFLPWLAGTAYLHSVLVQERRGMLKTWTICLSLATYLLCVFGTFLTRSGIVQSVHAFADAQIGPVFLLYIAIVILIALPLLLWRRRELSPEERMESVFSREAAFLLNNLVLIGICFATWWGVMFPVISEAFSGEKAVVGPSYFNAVNGPLFLILMFLMGYGPVVAWRRTGGRKLLLMFLWPSLIGSVVFLIVAAIDPGRVLPALSFGLASFVFATVVAEFHRGYKAQIEVSSTNVVSALSGMIAMRARRYGGFIVHLGIAIMAVAITASIAFKVERDLVLSIGQTAKVGAYEIEVASLRETADLNFNALTAEIEIRDIGGSAVIDRLYPQRRIYKTSGQSTTEVDTRTTFLGDLYIAFAGIDRPRDNPDSPDASSRDAVVLKVFVNPLQVWLWVGALIVLCGTLFVIVAGNENYRSLR